MFYYAFFVPQDRQLLFAIYVNYLHCFDFDDSCFTDIKHQLNVQFIITNLGEIFYYVDEEVDVEARKKIPFRQTNYVQKILKRFQKIISEPVFVLMDKKMGNSLSQFEPKADCVTIKWYQSTISNFILPIVYTKQDIFHSLEVLSWYYANTGPIVCNLVFHIFQYSSVILELRITFQADKPDNLVGYTDNDWAELCLKMSVNQLANMIFFSEENLCFTHSSNKLLLFFLRLGRVNS